MCKALPGIYLEIYFKGVDWQEVTQNCAKVIKVVLVTGVCHMKKKRLPADFNPILSFTVDLGGKKQQQ